MTAPRLLTLGVLLIAAPAFAQSDDEPAPAPAPAQPTRNNTTVYKCVNADGSVVFAESPCAADPAKVETIDTAGALLRGSGGNQSEIAAGVADSDCRARADADSRRSAEQIEESKRHVAEYQQRLQDLAQQPAYAAAGDDQAGGGGGAGADANRQAIDDLNSSIAREEEFQQKATESDEQAYQAALRACDEELRRNSAPPPQPAPQAPPADNDGGTPAADDGG